MSEIRNLSEIMAKVTILKNGTYLKSQMSIKKFFLISMFILTFSNFSKAQYCSDCVSCAHAVDQLNNYVYQVNQYYMYEWYTGIPYQRCPQYYVWGYYNNYWEVYNCHQQMYASLNQWYAQQVNYVNQWYTQIMYECANKKATPINQPTTGTNVNSQIAQKLTKEDINENKATQIKIKIPNNPQGFK